MPRKAIIYRSPRGDRAVNNREHSYEAGFSDGRRGRGI